jgi:hypothetical protein
MKEAHYREWENCMEKFTYRVEVNWDPEASVWIATSEDIPGLVTEEEALEALTKKLRIMVPELLQANDILSSKQSCEILFEIITQRLESVRLGL